MAPACVQTQGCRRWEVVVECIELWRQPPLIELYLIEKFLYLKLGASSICDLTLLRQKDLMWFIPLWDTAKINLFYGGGPGLVVVGGDSCFEGRGIESQHRVLGGHLFVVKSVMLVWKRRKYVKKRPGMAHLKNKFFLVSLCLYLGTYIVDSFCLL